MRQAPAIAVQGLTKQFGDVRAVGGISFTVERGSATALLGGNGAGKTTTLAMLLGLLVPTAGEIQLLGEDLIKRRYQLLPRLNFSSPYVDLPHRLTVEENLRVYAGLYGVRNPRQRLQSLAGELELGGLLRRTVGSLSAGQKTRVMLAKALVNEPELLLLDEPTASLDPETADFIRGYLTAYRARRGATILLASHDMGEVDRLCDQVLFLKHGLLVDRGTPQRLRERYGRESLDEVFADVARGSISA